MIVTKIGIDFGISTFLAVAGLAAGIGGDCLALRLGCGLVGGGWYLSSRALCVMLPTVHQIDLKMGFL